MGGVVLVDAVGRWLSEVAVGDGDDCDCDGQGLRAED